jgi:hypothetical protein
MARTVNLLTADSGLYSSTSSSVSIPLEQSGTQWTSTNSTLSIIATEFITTLRRVCRLAPSGTNDIELSLPTQYMPAGYSGSNISFNAKIKPSSQANITTLLSVDGETVPTGNQQTLSGGVYGAIQSNVVTIPDDGVEHEVSILITISDHDGGNIYLTYPNLIDDLAFYQNDIVGLSRSFMPDFYWEIDSQQQYPTAPYHRLIDILTSGIDETKKEYSAIYPFNRYDVDYAEELKESWALSSLVDPSNVRDKYVNWLAQFTGSQVRKNISNGTSSLLSNHALELEFIKWQLQTSHYGRAAGTRGALIEAAQRALIFTKNGTDSTLSVSITPNYNGDRWSFLIRTLENETPDASAGQSSAYVLAAVEPARPMGYKIYHETIGGFYLTLDDISYGRLSELRLGVVVAPTDAPDSIVVSSVTSNSATLTFLPLSVPGGGDGGGIISNYQYSLSTNGTTYGSYLTLSPAKGSPPITITGLSSSTNYWVKLKAVNEAGVSAVQSTAVTFTTSA